MSECPHVLAGRDNDTCPPILATVLPDSSFDCTTPPPSPPGTCNCTSCDVVTTPTQQCTPSGSIVGGEPITVSDGVGGVAGTSTDLCTALGGGLGILSAVLTILLVGVVLGWVWSCHRRRGKSGIHER